VPFALHASVCGRDAVQAFNEIECDRGTLGIFPATKILELLLANAGRLKKHGA
jgi:2,3-bisphosphoglycerate-independent phosphoglycerate mutase